MVDVDEEIVINSLAAGGDGVGRAADGRVVFARLTAPGDRVRITAPDPGARYLRASSVELLAAGPNRVEPRCAVFGQCGGCAWQHIAYPTQIEAKRQILSDAIERIGKFREPPPIEFVSSPSPYGYRGRTRLLSASGCVGYRRWRDHAIEPISSCPVLLPELDSELGALASRLATDESQARDSAREIEWELAAGSDLHVQSTPLGESGPETRGFESPIELEVGGERIRISPGGFAQANPSLYDSLFSIVVDALDGLSLGILLELFAGAGFFTVGLARRFERVVAVEAHAPATRDLEHNLERAGQGGVEVITARVEHALEKLDHLRPDVVLLDPPRTGLVRGAAERLAALETPRIVYLSCDPATLARDLKILCNDPTTGTPRYRLSRLTGVDLFPQTPHVEALAVLDRTPPKANS
ncbi:MAG: class I SAM-dependent RNA methyltransferase [Deltaproteobacteria bacterium]|nr:class I SAM-dependent RNA methyltransferase [Deltaproteobacteria bacterium]